MPDPAKTVTSRTNRAHEENMTRTLQPLAIADLSDFAKILHRQLDQDTRPSHLSLLNMLARAGGFQNFQHLRAQNLTTQLGRPIAAAEPIAATPPTADMKRVEAALRYFDAAGQMQSWPAKTKVQHLCLWGIWSRLPVRVAMSERQISDRLRHWHHFNDAAILRRTLVELRLLSRTVDCTTYTRQERAPDADAAALIRLLHQRPAPAFEVSSQK
jgi:hypothetical protein